MFIYCEDWSHPIFFDRIKKLGIPYGDKFIKIFSSPIDPRTIKKDKSALAVFEESGTPFTNNKAYPYTDRDTLHASDLEETVRSLLLSDEGAAVVRSLFRFTSHDDVGITQQVMSMKKGDDWFLSHACEEIDGIHLKKRFTGEKDSLTNYETHLKKNPAKGGRSSALQNVGLIESADERS